MNDNRRHDAEVGAIIVFIVLIFGCLAVGILIGHLLT
jgi:hypothetical protein